MYAIAAFYLEVETDHIPGDGWSAVATFSRRRDYKHHDAVTKTRFDPHLSAESKGAAERATLQWARKFVDSSAAVIESSIRLRNDENLSTETVEIAQRSNKSVD